MATAQQVLREGILRFTEFAQEQAETKLDGTLTSLMGAGLVLHKCYEWYQRGKAANDSDHEKFADQMAFWATCYVGDVLTRQFKGSWDTAEGKVAIRIRDTVFPLAALMIDEVKNGKKHSLLLIKQIDNVVARSAPKPELIADDSLAVKMQAFAMKAVQEVKTALKEDLDYTPASLANVDRALVRVKGLIEMGPEYRQQMTVASCETYGAYIGEVLLKQTPGKWISVKRGDALSKAVQFGESVTIPELIVGAVLEGKSLNMGKRSARSVVEFFECCRATEAETRRRRETTPQFMIDNLETIANEAVQIAARFGQTLDFTLFSLPALDAAIKQKCAEIQGMAESEAEPSIAEKRALAGISFGVYLGETLRRVHGGTWEKNPADPDNKAPRIRHRRYLLLPIESCVSVVSGKPIQLGGRQVTTLQQYYQEARPLLEDAMVQRLLGGQPNFEALLKSMGPNPDLNRTAIEFAESCVLQARAHHDVVLDFSEHSLRHVDDILQKIRSLSVEQKKGTEYYDTVNLIYWYGFYSGEVYRRVLTGSWMETPRNGAEHIVWLEVEGTKIYVLSKVQKALRDGAADSVAFMLHAVKGILEDQRKKKAADTETAGA